MKDIADAAGVSVMTVSRALREPDRVSEDTHKKIEKAIRKIGYIRDFIAESMRTNQTGIVSLLVPTLANSFFSTFIRGVSDTLQQRGYQLMICDYNYDLGLEERQIEACIGRRSDGIVTAGLEHSSKTRSLLERSHIPVVETWDLAPNVIDSQVGFSNVDAGTALAKHLIAEGYKRVALIGTAATRRLVKRETGFVRAFEAAGLPEPIIREVSGYAEYKAGREAIADLVQRRPRIEAVACRNDAMAAGALFECQRRGIVVPKQMAITGFGDFEIASAIHPGLTTVRIPSHDIGVKATEVLLERLGGAEAGKRIDVGFEVIARGTT